MGIEKKVLLQIWIDQHFRQLHAQTNHLRYTNFSTASDGTLELLKRSYVCKGAVMSVCKTCDEELVLRLDDDADNDDTETAETVPDDLELGCGCHFHW
jgi:hypothetical protein